MSYRSTIARQPEQLGQSLATIRAAVADLDLAPFATGALALTGIGASYEAAVVATGELQRLGRRAAVWHAVDLMQPGDPADAIIALSAGGRSIEPVTALQTHKLPSLALTSQPGMPLSQAASHALAFQSGGDATPSSTGYTATLLAAGLVIDALTGKAQADWDALPAQVAEVLAQSGEKIARALAVWENRRAIDCVGAVSSLGTAGGAGLLIREAARIPAGATDTLHYLHGPMESNDGETGVIVFGDGREVQLAQDMAAQVGSAVVLVTAQDVAETDRLTVIRVPATESRIARGILDIIPAQLLAASLSDAAGLTDTKFRYRQTDTKIKAE